MKSGRRVRDPLLSPWPPVYQDEDGYFISVKFLPPFVIAMVDHVFVEPIEGVWKLALFVLICDGLIHQVSPWTIFLFTDIDRWVTYGAMAAIWAVWKSNLLARYGLSNILFGYRFGLRCANDGSIWLRRCRYRREWGLAFAVNTIEDAEDKLYQRSRRISLIVGNSREVRLTSIFGEDRANSLVRNANVMLSMTNGGRGRESNIDRDPTRN